MAETIEIAREVCADVPIILGGIYATLCYEHARAHTGADYIVQGRAGNQWLELLKSLVGPGENPQGSSELPAYHLLDNLDSVSMVTSFGCPFSCAYCASRLLSDGFRQRGVDAVVTEISSYRTELGVRDIAFYDDALLINSENHMKPILRELINQEIDVRLHTPNGLHANLIDEELAGLMKKSGFSTIRLSVESVNPGRMRDSCMKVTAEGFERAVRFLSAAGYPAGSLEAYILMGAPQQQPEEVQETMRFVHEKGVVIRLADFSPIPGTEYFERACSLFGLDLNEPLVQNSSILPYFVPGKLDEYQRLKQLARLLNGRLKK